MSSDHWFRQLQAKQRIPHLAQRTTDEHQSIFGISPAISKGIDTAEEGRCNMHSTPLRHVHCDRSVGIGQPLLARSRWKSFAIGLPRGATLR
jgi:hypothetical protein